MPMVDRYKYEANDGSIHTIKMTAERFAAAGTEPVGNVDDEVIVKQSKSNTEHGIRPRSVTLVRTVGTPPDECKKYTTLPVLSIADFALPAFAIGATITIGGVAWEIIVRNPEDF